MRFGIVTPIVTRVPAAHARWEEAAGINEITRIVAEADRLGYDFCTCSEHVAVPADAAALRGGTYWDPLATFGYLAARTSRIRFATFVLVLGYHHPLAIAKRYGTLDQVSNGRVVLGVGVGSLEEEFVLLGAEFDQRGAIGDDAIRALRAALSKSEPEYHGDYFTFGGFLVDPSAMQETVPIWVGGRTGLSLRRAVAMADGWAPFGLRSAELGDLLDGARDNDAWNARSEPLDVVVQNDRAFDPMGDPDRVAAQIARYEKIGATGLAARLVHHSLDHYLEQLAALMALT